MRTKSIYLVLCILGTLLPYWQFIPWLAVNGLNLPLFFHQLFANRIGAFFGMDVLVSAVSLMVLTRRESTGLHASTHWIVLGALLIVGVSLALPLFLYLRVRGAERAGSHRTLTADH